MTTSRLATLAFFLLATLAPLRATPPTDSLPGDPVLLTVGDREVHVSEFRYIYEKNNPKAAELYKEDNLREYLGLFINFKLKVAEGYATGLDTLPALREEMDTYRRQLAGPYLTEKQIAEGLAREAYDRMKTEVRASHILLAVPVGAMGSDTVAAYEKIKTIREKALKGQSFESLARQYSDDPSAAMNGGDLGYFRGLRMVYEFENVAYQTPVGQVSQIFRTEFGYHILKVVDKRPSRGVVTVAHLMLRAPSGISTEDSVAAKRKIDELYKRAKKKSANWDELVTQFSDHGPSKGNGGRLDPFAAGGLGLPTFEEAAFSIKKPGKVAKPVHSPYGWHIIKLIEREPVAPYDSMAADLRRQVLGKSRAKANKERLFETLKTRHNLRIDGTAEVWLKANAEPLILAANTRSPGSDLDLRRPLAYLSTTDTLFSADLMEYLTKNNRSIQGASYEARVLDGFGKLQRYALEEFELDNLPSREPAYASLLREFEEGTILFRLMEEKVWNKAIADTAGLRTFFAANRDNYHFEERVKASMYSVPDLETLAQLKSTLEKEPALSQNELLARFNQSSALNLQINDGTYGRGQNKLLDKVEWAMGDTTVQEGKRYVLVRIEQVLPARQKTLAESRGLAIADYQAKLEEEWLKSLRVKYPVELDESVVESLIR